MMKQTDAGLKWMSVGVREPYAAKGGEDSAHKAEPGDGRVPRRLGWRRVLIFSICRLGG